MSKGREGLRMSTGNTSETMSSKFGLTQTNLKPSVSSLVLNFLDFSSSGNLTVVDEPLVAVSIYFGTETYDEYERDVKVL